MAIVGGGNMAPMTVIQMFQVTLIQIKDAMNAAQSLGQWAQGVSLDDLTAEPPVGPGMDEANAQALLSAAADAWGHAQLWFNGNDPRNVPAGYNYGQSQRLVIGPRLR